MAMDEDKYQKELFGEFEKPKRLFPRISDLFPKADFERNVALTLTLDKAVFIAIGIVMVMVAVYALGVEAGKRRSAEPVQAQAAPSKVPAVSQVSAVPAASRMYSREAAEVLSGKGVVAEPVATVFRQGGPYTILAATFSNKDNALQEVRKLRLQGLDAMLIQKDSRFLACVGSYKDKASVQGQTDLKKVKRLHSDAYIRLK